MGALGVWIFRVTTAQTCRCGSPSSQKTKESPHQVITHVWLLYALRFILVGDLLGAWSTFGGISAQLSHLGIPRHLAITEHVTILITYDAERRAHIQRLARLRGDDTDFVRILNGEHDEIKQRLKIDRGKSKAKKPYP